MPSIYTSIQVDHIHNTLVAENIFKKLMQAPIAHDLEKQKTFYHSLMLGGRRRLDKKGAIKKNKRKQKMHL